LPTKPTSTVEPSTWWRPKKLLPDGKTDVSDWFFWPIGLARGRARRNPGGEQGVGTQKLAEQQGADFLLVGAWTLTLGVSQCSRC